MIRFAVPPIGGQDWFGGWMYMRNLVRALSLFGQGDIETVVFVGSDKTEDAYVRELRTLPRTRVIVAPEFNADQLRGGTLRTLATGRRTHLLDAFGREKIDVALDWAMYYGWRSEIPVIAWLPDFQHRTLPHLFGRFAWLRRETGFRLQISASCKVLLSSQAAEQDCHSFYPSSRGKTHVAQFAVPIEGWPDPEKAREIVAKAGIPQNFVFLPNQLWHHKNHALAIDAAGILAQRGSKTVIVATGRGSDPRRPSYRSELIDRIGQKGAGSNFILLDGVDYDLVKAMMIRANALLNPSRFEGWSTTVEEAKAVGTPMLLSDLVVHREQAPGAMFFGKDDVGALAKAIEACPVRSAEQIQASKEVARQQNLIDQACFAQSLSDAVRKSVKSRASQ